MLRTTTELRVRFSETDRMKFVYNPKYYEYFEIGRTEMLRDIGLSYKSIEDQGYHLPVIESKAKYLSPAFYDEIIIIESMMEELPAIKIHIDYNVIRKSDHKLLAQGYTEHVFMKDSSGKAVRCPQFFLDKVKGFFGYEN